VGAGCWFEVCWARVKSLGRAISRSMRRQVRTGRARLWTSFVFMSFFLLSCECVLSLSYATEKQRERKRPGKPPDFHSPCERSKTGRALSVSESTRTIDEFVKP